MSVGVHLSVSDWNARALQLFQAYTNFCDQATELAAYLAPVNDAYLQSVGFLQADVVTLRSGVNVAAALAALSALNVAPGAINTTQAATASQCAVALGAFGGA